MGFWFLVFLGPPVNKRRLQDQRDRLFLGDPRIDTPSATEDSGEILERQSV